jgi:hypothetical protein
MAKFEIIENHPSWERFISNVDCPSPFATEDFLHLIDSCYDGKTFTVSVVSSGNIFLGAALRRVGKQIRPAPPMTYMPIVYGPVNYRNLLDAEIALAQYLKKNFSVVHYITATNFFQDVRGFQRENFGMQVLYTAVNDLSDFDITKVEQKQRNIIYKAQREQITIEQTNEMEPLWDIYINTFSRKSIEVPYPKEFFMALPTLGEKIRIYVAKKGENAVGFAAILLQGKAAYYYVSGNTSDGLSLGASPLLMFTILDQLKSEGYRYFDWCAINLPRLANFKLSFGGKAVPYFALYYEPRWLRMVKAR